MEIELYNQIRDELRLFLNREPTENEIMNSHSDINIMNKVKDKINSHNKEVLQKKIDAIQAKIDIIDLAIK